MKVKKKNSSFPCKERQTFSKENHPGKRKYCLNFPISGYLSFTKNSLSVTKKTRNNRTTRSKHKNLIVSTKLA